MEWRRSRYDEDVHAWAEEQAEALRRLAETRRDLPNELDLENVAEEIEDVGVSQRTACESYIRQIFVHLIKLISAPESASATHWRGEIITFHNELLQRLTRSMHARIELTTLWHRALREATAKLRAEEKTNGAVYAKLRGPPLTIEELAGEDFDVDLVLASLSNNL
jgi:hypothetical protein